MLLIVGVITGLLSRCFLAVADSPASVWVLLLALATGCFAQLAVKPQNMPVSLALMVAVLVTWLIRSDPAKAGPLPIFIGVAAALAVLVTFQAHALLPMRAPRRPPPSILPAQSAKGLRFWCSRCWSGNCCLRSAWMHGPRWAIGC